MKAIVCIVEILTRKQLDRELHLKQQCWAWMWVNLKAFLVNISCFLIWSGAFEHCFQWVWFLVDVRQARYVMLASKLYRLGCVWHLTEAKIVDAHKYIFYSDFQQTTTRPQISCFSQGFLCGSLYFVHEFSVQVSNQDNWSLRVWVCKVVHTKSRLLFL